LYILIFSDIKNVCIVMKSYHWSRQHQNYNTIYPALVIFEESNYIGWINFGYIWLLTVI